MSTKLVIKTDQRQMGLANELVDALKTGGLEISRGPRTRGEPIVDIIVALGSVGAFTSLYKIICNFFIKDKDRKLIIKHKGGEIEIVGHSLPDEMALLQKIAPDLAERKKSE